MEPQLTVKKEPLGKNVFINVSKHHSFGTDAVLLSDFAKPKKTDRLVDLGTGCGIIAFLIKRDFPEIKATCVDISKEATELCSMTVADNGIKDFTVINSDLKELKGKVEFGSNTLVTCNPPYKADGTGLKNPDKTESVARHEVECTAEDIISVGARLLQTGGRFCICQRPERLSEMMTLMHKFKVEPKRLRLVCQRKGEEPWLFLIEGKRCANVGLRIEPTLYVENENGDWSKEMLKIYGSYKEAYL